MAREYLSLSGVPLEMTDKDRIICIIGDLPWIEERQLNGRAVVGMLNAVKIKRALQEEGFEIVRKQIP